jgi:hypothetical protein
MSKLPYMQKRAAFLDTARYMSSAILRAGTLEEEAILFSAQLKEFVSGADGLGVIYRTQRREPRRAIPRAIRLRVLSVGKCLRCESTHDLTIDHIFPVSKGGSNRERNLRCLCRSCNSSKGARILK